MRWAISAGNHGFTRVDLVALATLVALLGLLLLPVLGDSERHSRAAGCSINVKKLVGGWSAFAADHADALPFNANAPSGQFDWCGSSFLDLTPPIRTTGTMSSTPNAPSFGLMFSTPPPSPVRTIQPAHERRVDPMQADSSRALGAIR